MKSQFAEASRLPLGRALILASAFALLAACTETPPPRSFAFFMEDQIAREGTLARCDRYPEASATDIECANARRAVVALALRRERERREAVEREAELKLEQMRQRIVETERIARDSALAAAAAEREAYERRWREQTAAALREAETGDTAPPAAPSDPWGTAPPVPAAEPRLEAGDLPEPAEFETDEPAS